MARHFTDFSEYAANQAPSDWTKRYTGSGVIRVRATDLPLGATNGRVLETTGSGLSYNAWDVLNGTSGNVDIVMKYLRTSGTDIPSMFFYGYDDGRRYTYYPSDQFGFRIARQTGASNYTPLGDAVTNPVLATNTWWLIRFQRTGTTIQFKYWAWGSAEPGSWLVSTTDNVHTTGYVGIRTASSIFVDFVSVGTGADLAYIPSFEEEDHNFSLQISESEDLTILDVPIYAGDQEGYSLSLDVTEQVEITDTPILHKDGDIIIDGKPFQRMTSGDSVIVRRDSQPATSRAAMGEGSLDYFVNDSFVAQSSLNGGMGQERLTGIDRYNTGVAAIYPGAIFPARKHRGVLGEITNKATHKFTATRSRGVELVPSVQRPVVTGTDAIFTSDNGGHIYRSQGDFSQAVTPPGLPAELVAPLGRYLFAFARRSQTIDVSISMRQQVVEIRTNPTTSVPVVYDLLTRGGNMLMLCVAVEGPAVSTPTISGWTLYDEQTHATSGQKHLIFWKEADFNETDVTVTLSDSRRCTVWFYEIAGVDLSGDPFLDFDAETESHTSVSSVGQYHLGSLPGIASGDLGNLPYMVFSMASVDKTAGGTPGGSMLFQHHILNFDLSSQLTSSSGDPGTGSSISGWPEFAGNMRSIVPATAPDGGVTARFWASLISPTATVTFHQMLSIFALKAQPPQSISVENMTIFYSSDDGLSWTEVESELGSSIGRLKAWLPAEGALWLTTDNGLYRMTYEDYEFEDQSLKLNVGLIGPLDEWPIPLEDGSGGEHLVILDGIIYYSTGSSIRRYAPGAGAAQVWPLPDWSNKAGTVRSMIHGERGIYFSADGLLYLFTGRSVHAFAQEPDAGAFDSLFMHGGRLYFNSPDTWFRFDYPSSRPDFYTTDPLDFETGAVISSAMDFDKISLDKLLSRFETHVRFIGTGDTGYVELSYLDADANYDPGLTGGLADSLPWIKIGEHRQSDGGIQVYTREDWELDVQEIRARAIYLRVLIVPGEDGYPVVKSPWVAQGVTIMPDRKIIDVPLMMQVGQRDPSGGRPYSTIADVVAAISEIERLRADGGAFDLQYDDGTEIGRKYRVFMETMSDQSNIRLRRLNGGEWMVQVQFRELP